jgi:hypothetical protein
MTKINQMTTMKADDDTGVGTDGVLKLDSNWQIYYLCTSHTSREAEMKSWKMPKGFKTPMINTVKSSQDGSEKFAWKRNRAFSYYYALVISLIST